LLSNRILAVDLGQIKTGIAITDPTGHIVTPLCIYKHKNIGSVRDLADYIALIVKEKTISKIIIGYPDDEQGNETKASQKVDKFILRLNNRTSVSVEKFSEYNSTKRAINLMIDNYGKKTRRKMDDDAIAAAIILQDYLQYVNKKENYER
jgi:putative Holliday junction resolvase